MRDLQLGAVSPAGAAACQESQGPGKAGLLPECHCYRYTAKASSSTWKKTLTKQ